MRRHILAILGLAGILNLVMPAPAMAAYEGDANPQIACADFKDAVSSSPKLVKNADGTYTLEVDLTLYAAKCRGTTYTTSYVTRDGIVHLSSTPTGLGTVASPMVWKATLASGDWQTADDPCYTPPPLSPQDQVLQALGQYTPPPVPQVPATSVASTTTTFYKGGFVQPDRAPDSGTLPVVYWSCGSPGLSYH
jgi:hypothetical protein